MRAERASNNLAKASASAAAAVLLAVLITPSPALHAEIYSWTDEGGNMHFTDRPETLPRKYLDTARVRDDESSRSWEYLASEYGVDYYYDSSNVTYTNRNRFNVLIKESYAGTGREEYETQIVLDCARLLYKPTQSVRVYKKQRTPVDVRHGREGSGPGGNQDGYQRFSHPYQVLSRMICRDSGR